MISDTTIVSSGIQGVEVVRRIRHQGVWSGLVLLSGVILFGVFGVVMNLPSTVGDAAEAISKITPEVWTQLAEKENLRLNYWNKYKQEYRYIW